MSVVIDKLKENHDELMKYIEKLEDENEAYGEIWTGLSKYLSDRWVNHSDQLAFQILDRCRRILDNAKKC